MDAQNQPKNFFVSYNKADRFWAEWIAWEIEEAGYSTVLQAWDFRPGSNFVLEMDRATKQADRTIAILSPDYLKALYTQPEWTAAFAEDPTGAKGTLLPIRVRECELEGLLNQIVYIDLVGSDEEIAKQNILEGIERERAKPLTKPKFPGTIPRAVPDQPAFPGMQVNRQARPSTVRSSEREMPIVAHQSVTKAVLGFIKEKKEWLAILIGATGLIRGTANFVTGNTTRATILLIFLSVLMLVVGLLYILLKKVETSVDALMGVSTCAEVPQRHYAYSRRSRLFAIGGLIVLLLFGAGGVGIWKFYRGRPMNELIILVTRLDGPDPQNYRVQENIVEHLREATKRYPEVKVQILDKAVTSEEGSDVAHMVGKNNNASLVLWGWYAKTGLSVEVVVHFELLRGLKYLTYERNSEILRTPLIDLESFDLQFRLSSQMNYLTLLTVGLVRYEADDFQGAIRSLTAALEQPSKLEEVVSPAICLYYRGNANLLANQYDEAIADFDKAISLDPSNGKAYIQRGSAYCCKADYKHAITDLSKGITLEPDRAEAYNNRGAAYIKSQNYEKAIADFDKAISLDPNDADAYSNRGATCSTLQNYEKAITDFDKAISLDPNNAGAYVNRGRTYDLMGEHGAAIIELTRAINIDPTNPDAFNNRGNAYRHNGEVDKAIADHYKALELKPDDADLCYNLGNEYHDKGDYDNAIAYYSKAIDLKPDHENAHNNRGLLYGDMGHYDKAIADLSEAVHLSSSNPHSYFNFAKVYSQKGDYDNAIAYYSKAIDLKPDFGDAYYNRANTYELKGMHKQAVADYSSDIRLNPNHIAAYVNRGLAYGDIGDYSQAIADFDKAIILKPNFGVAYWDRGAAKEKKGLTQEALVDFKKALDCGLPPDMKSIAEKHIKDLSSK